MGNDGLLKNSRGKCLGIVWNWNWLNFKAIQVDCKVEDGQKWKFDGSYLVNGFGHCLTAFHFLADDRNHLVQWTCLKNENQKSQAWFPDYNLIMNLCANASPLGGPLTSKPIPDSALAMTFGALYLQSTFT